jgi:hypothetical protein
MADAINASLTYDDANSTAHFVARHGGRLRPFTVTGITRDDATGDCR